MADLRSNFVGIKSPNPFWLASAPPTDKEYNVVPRLQGGLGRRGVEDAGRGRPAHRQRQRPALWRDLGRGPPAARPQQHRTDHRPAAGGEPAGDQEGQARLAGPGHGRLADGAVRRRRAGRPSCRASRRPRLRRGRAELRLPARHEPSAAWAPPWARCRNTSRWSRAGASSTPACRCIVKLTPNITDIRYPARAAHARRGGCGVADQHDQLDHHRRPRQLRARADDRRQGQPWRLLRPGGEAHRAQHGGRDRPRRAKRAACRSPASAASPPGATRRSSWRLARATCRSARRR